MQVADNHELTTSATIGGAKAMSFGISDDPAFFHVLSSSLYNNPTLAVVRETICNSWDAHIEAGKTDLPIKISVDRDNFIIFRDYGNGIPNSNIQAVYGTYGASTKKSNNETTGGFGLGCKSPFAYVDSFQVTSWNQGKMSIYNVTKSSVETDGKPGIIPIVTNANTLDSGLEVKFQLNKGEVGTFIEYIKSIVFNGEIKALLELEMCNKNEEGYDWVTKELPTLGMSFEPGSYNIENDWYLDYMGRGSVFIRYGNVIYPAIESTQTKEAINLIENFMNIIGSRRILIQAAPSTLAVAPSRETLSNQKMTDDGITNLCIDIAYKLEKDIKEGIPNAIKEIEYNIKSNPITFFRSSTYYMDLVKDRKIIKYMKSSLWYKAKLHYMAKWGNMAIDAYLGQDYFKGLGINFNKARGVVKKAKRDNNYHIFNEWLNRKIILPYLADLHKSKLSWDAYIFSLGSSPDNCFVYKNKLNNFLSECGQPSLLHIVKSKTVVVTKRMQDLGESFKGYPGFTNEADYQKSAFVVRIGSKKGEAEIATKKYQALGYTVVDLTQDHDWDEIAKYRKNEREAAAKKRAKKKADLLAKGMEGSTPNRLISIKSIKLDLGDNGVLIRKECANPECWKQYNHIDVEEPKYYVLQSEIRNGSVKDNPYITAMYKWSDISEDILDCTIVCRNGIEVNKAIKRGAVHLNTKRYLELMDILKSKGFKKYATEQRPDIFEYLQIGRKDTLALFGLLGIKFKALDNLVYNPAYQWVVDFIYKKRNQDIKNMIELGVISSVCDLDQYIPLIDFRNHKSYDPLNQLQNKFCYKSMAGLLAYTDFSQIISWLKGHPEDIPGYKSIIRNIINRKATYES